MPGLWQAGKEGEIVLSNALIYLFAVWCIAIFVAAILSRHLSEPVVGDSDVSDHTPDG